MDEKTEELRDIFVDATGAEAVTDRQEETRGTLPSDREAIKERVEDVVAGMRERYEFEAGLSTAELRRVVTGFFDGEDDAAIAEALGSDAAAVFEARMDLHLVGEGDREAPFDLGELRSLMVEGADLEECVAALDSDADTVAHFGRVIAAEREATRANSRYRDEFAELLTDEDIAGRLASEAREDGLKEATEDIETEVSF